MTRSIRATAVIVICLPLVAVTAAQTTEHFRDRLSRLPVDRATTASISGEGEVRATLDGDQLTITATFEGMSSNAVAAHIHRGPRAQPGPVVFEVDVPASTSGAISETLTLSDPQRDTLRRGSYYLQIHTEHNPGGELRGWLLPD